jgi:hypothetical protein
MADSHARFIWYELTTTDMQAAKAFYAAVVGWGTRDASMAGMPFTASRVEAAQRHQSTWLACGSNKRHVRSCPLTATRPQLQIRGSLHHGRSST